MNFCALKKDHMSKTLPDTDGGSSFLVKKVLVCVVVVQLIYVIYAIVHYKIQGRLPGPFFYDAGDTFMDYFSTNFWAFREERFQDWKSIYPIFVFQFGQWVSDSSCVWKDPFFLRACDTVSILPLFICYFLGVFSCERIISNLFKWGWRKYFFYRLNMCLALSLSMPGLFALERGNYVLLSFTCLAFSALAGYGWIGAAFIAIAINIKQYLVVLIFVPFLKERYEFVLKVLLFSLLVNIGGLLQVGEAHYGMLIENMADFTGASAQSFLTRIWFPTSFSGWEAFAEYLTSQAHIFPVWAGTVFELLFSCVRIFLVIAISCIFWMLFLLKKRIDGEYVYFIVLISIMSILGSLGGYALILTLPYAAAMFKRENMRPAVLVFILLLLPIDFPLPPAFHFPNMENSFGQKVGAEVYLTSGAYLRPTLVMGMVIFIFRDLYIEIRCCLKGN